MLKALTLVAKEHPVVSPGVISEAREPIAVLQMLECLRNGHVVICCVDSDEHWVVAFGLLGGGERLRVHVSDSADPELVQHYTPQAFGQRWRGKGRKPYYGIVV